MAFKRYLRTVLLVAVILGATFGAATAKPEQQTSRPLFTAVEQPESAHASAEPTVARQRFVRVNQAELENVRPGQKLILNLFADLELTATIEEVSDRGETASWVGSIDGSDLGQVFLVSTEGQIAGDVSTPEGLYQVRYSGGELYAIQQIDEAQFPEEAPPIELNVTEARAFAESQGKRDLRMPDAVADSGSLIDVMVVYTPAARAAQGGATAMLNLANLAAVEANQSYANSGIAQRVNLVFVGEMAYTETYNMTADLERLRLTSDGYMDEVHALRNLYKADLVSMISNSTQYCGMAYHMSSTSAWFSESAFSVISRICATGYYSFAHEMGHNMGARHDWFVDNQTTPSTYSHGYVNTAGRWRTIMAYDSECTQRGFNCRRLPYWANPAVTYSGAAMGVNGGTNATCQAGILNHPACDADDHRTLNDTAYTVANFRTRTASAPPPTPRPIWDYPHHVFLPNLTR